MSLTTLVWRLRALAAALLLGAAPAFAAGAFDDWSEKFAADWMRLSPEFSSMSRYFSGAEQDALDRQLRA